MSIFNVFRFRKDNSAALAKERLQIIVAHERSQRKGPDYLPLLQKEIVEVIAKYVNIKKNDVHVNFQNVGDCSILELNITLPEEIVQE